MKHKRLENKRLKLLSFSHHPWGSFHWSWCAWWKSCLHHYPRAQVLFVVCGMVTMFLWLWYDCGYDGLLCSCSWFILMMMEWTCEGLAWEECDVKPGPVFKLPLIIKWKANIKKRISKTKLDTLSIKHRNSTKISKHQKKTNPPKEKENQYTIYLLTLIGRRSTNVYTTQT